MFSVILIDDEKIISSDIRMPKKNGLEMIAAMKDINQDAQIIILTGLRELEYAQEAIRLGVVVSDDDKPQFIVSEAIEFIKKNYNKKLNLQVVADSLYVSTWHLCKVLKKETGTNFVDLLNGIRIEQAKEFLVTTNLRIYEIASKVGYSDTAYFSKIFKRFLEMTPNEYRNTQYGRANSKIGSF